LLLGWRRESCFEDVVLAFEIAQFVQAILEPIYEPWSLDFLGD
jgi:hypothetical protein